MFLELARKLFVCIYDHACTYLVHGANHRLEVPGKVARSSGKSTTHGGRVRDLRLTSVRIRTDISRNKRRGLISVLATHEQVPPYLHRPSVRVTRVSKVILFDVNRATYSQQSNHLNGCNRLRIIEDL